VEYNYTRGERDIRLFELGTAFAAGAGPTPAETARLGLVLTGARAPLHWTGDSGDYLIWDLKGLAEEIVNPWGLTVRPGLATELPGVTPLLDPAASFEIVTGDRLIGQAGPLRAGAADVPAWAGAIFGLELILDERFRAGDREYQPLPQLPAIKEDLALLVPDAVTAAQIEQTLRAAGGALLEDAVAFDLYRGAGLPVGTRSIAYRLRFRAPDRTLTDADVRTQVGRILKRLKDEHGIERRG
jgi:phenylalanyl-tRNA synthetase beta chain